MKTPEGEARIPLAPARQFVRDNPNYQLSEQAIETLNLLCVRYHGLVTASFMQYNANLEKNPIIPKRDVLDDTKIGYTYSWGQRDLQKHLYFSFEVEPDPHYKPEEVTLGALVTAEHFDAARPGMVGMYELGENYALITEKRDSIISHCLQLIHDAERTDKNDLTLYDLNRI